MPLRDVVKAHGGCNASGNGIGSGNPCTGTTTTSQIKQGKGFQRGREGWVSAATSKQDERVEWRKVAGNWQG
jgi:hypothetical protein